ncbi:M20 family metallopeptidase, partial [Gemmatimonadota bacterium]
GERILAEARKEEEAMVSFLMELASLESPSDVPESQLPVQALLTRSLEELGFRVRKILGRKAGGALYAVPRDRLRGRPAQLLLGHCDTVWKVGTLDTMPVVRGENRLRGPGVFDMKAGLTQMIVALRILKRLGLEPEVTPVILINSDEEIGSPDSARIIRLLSRRVVRAFVPEPAMGPQGKLKTVRKGVGRFVLRVKGRAAHAGLDPTGGASAILELSYLIQKVHAMTDLERGVTFNVGVISGGTRPNVIAPEAVAEVDVRILSGADGEEAESWIRGLTTTVPGTALEVEGGILIPPLERTPRNRALWEQARRAAGELGLDLEEEVAGGGSDGNTTSQFTATLDGLGAVGDGAHAPHEFLFVDRQVERCALLALLLLLPPGG